MKQITGHTMLTGLLGSPVSHSISPAIHNEAFKQLNLDYVYLAFDVKEEEMADAVRGFRALNVRGFNVTMPGKTIMASLCDHLSPAAKLSNSVNTVVNENGVLIGHNTDGVGYMRSVKEAGYNIIGKKMTILGAGATASSIMVQAALDGVSEISVFSRSSASFDCAKRLIETLNQDTSCQLKLYDIEEQSRLKAEISESTILVNATAVGMSPNTEQCLIADKSFFHKGLIVSDVIYHPRETKLLTRARECGCHTFNGLYMLLYQGAESFKLWTGKDMPIRLIKETYFSE